MLQQNKKNQRESEELVDGVIQEKNPFQNVELDDIWIEDDLYDSKDPRSIAETSKKIIDEVMPSPLIDLNVPTPPDNDDEIDNAIDFTISDSQLVERNYISIDRETEPFIDLTVTDSRVDDSVETEPFVDFTINDSRVARVVDTEDGIETINITTDNDIVIPDINTIGGDDGPRKCKKLVTTHLTEAVCAANKIKKKYEKKKRIGKKSARISTDGTLFKKVNKKNAEWLKNNGFLNNDVPVEKADVGESINLKKTSGVSVAAKNIVKKYRNLARKKPYGKRPSMVVVKDNHDPNGI